MDPSYPPHLPSEGQLGDPSKLSKSVDKSEALFTMYLERSDEDDRKTTERWKGECDAILIFTGLFSAALAALLSISMQGIQQNSQDTSAFYLKNIYHVLANATTSQPIILPTLSDPPPFSPLKASVVVNALWFLSLSMSLTGALLAVFIQQWALSYLQATQGRHSPRERARIRSYHAEGLEKLYLHRVTRAVPILIHISLFLFFSGLPVFLFNVNRTVFNVVATWIALCMAGYACITLMPIFCHNSPYYSPLSSSIWWCVTNTLFIVYRLLRNFLRRDSFVLKWYRYHYAGSHLRWPSLRSMQKAAARFALQLTSDIDYRALSWMFNTLNDDDEFEQFFDALPSLCDSEALEHPQRAFITPNQNMLSRALIGMMDRTLLSDLVPKEVKQRRIIICVKAIDATSLLGPWWTLRRVLFGDWHGFSRSIHFGLFVQSWKGISHLVTAFYAQYVIAITLASVQVRDDNWFRLASGQLNASKSLLRNSFAEDDSILLANAIFIIRRTIQTFSASEERHRSDIIHASSKALEILSGFDIQNTLAEHRHQFCSLWNQLVYAAQDDSLPHCKSVTTLILKKTRRLYITLHEGTNSSPTAFSTTTEDGNRDLDNAMSYPKCQVVGHNPSRPVPGLQIGEPPLHGPGNAHRSIDDPTAREVTPEVSPVSVPLAVLPPAFITPTQVPVQMPGTTPMVIPGAGPTVPSALGTGGTSATANHFQMVNTVPEVPRRSLRFQRHVTPAAMDTGPSYSAQWYSPPQLPPSSFTPGPGPPFTQPGTVPQMLPPSQPGVVPPMPPPYTQSVILPPIFNDMMAMVRENRFMHLAALEQQRELMRYMNSLNEWLGHDVEDRQAELRGVADRIDQLRDDVNRLGLTGMMGSNRLGEPSSPSGPGVEPGGFIVPDPGAPDAPGDPGDSPVASRFSGRPTSIFSRARQLFSSGTVPQHPQVSTPQLSIQQDPIGVSSTVSTHGYGMPTPIESPMVPSPPPPDGGVPFISPDLGSVRESIVIPSPQIHQSAVPASGDDVHTPLEPSNSTTTPRIELLRSPSLVPVAVPDPQIPPRMLVHTPPLHSSQLGGAPSLPRSRSPPPSPPPIPGQPTVIVPPQLDVVSLAIPSTSTKPISYDSDRDGSGLVPLIADRPLLQASPRPGHLELPVFDDRQNDPLQSK